MLPRLADKCTFVKRFSECKVLVGDGPLHGIVKVQNKSTAFVFLKCLYSTWEAEPGGEEAKRVRGCIFKTKTNSVQAGIEFIP